MEVLNSTRVCLYLPIALHELGVTHSQFKRILTYLNSNFSYFWTGYPSKAKGPSLLFYLPIAEGRIIGFIFLCINAMRDVI